MHCATMHGMQLAAGVMQYSRRFSAEDGAMDSRLTMAHMLDLFFPFLANRKGVCRLGGRGGKSQLSTNMMEASSLSALLVFLGRGWLGIDS